jgi:hypothetical protein
MMSARGLLSAAKASRKSAGCTEIFDSVHG